VLSDGIGQAQVSVDENRMLAQAQRRERTGVEQRQRIAAGRTTSWPRASSVALYACSAGYASSMCEALSMRPLSAS